MNFGCIGLPGHITVGVFQGYEHWCALDYPGYRLVSSTPWIMNFGVAKDYPDTNFSLGWGYASPQKAPHT